MSTHTKSAQSLATELCGTLDGLASDLSSLSDDLLDSIRDLGESPILADHANALNAIRVEMEAIRSGIVNAEQDCGEVIDYMPDEAEANVLARTLLDVDRGISDLSDALTLARAIEGLS